MEMKFELLDICQISDFPYLRVRARPVDDPSLSPLRLPSITVELPVKNLSGSLPELALQAVQTAQQIIHAEALEAWLKAQAVP